MNVLWLQSGGCGGCSMSLLCAESPGLVDSLEGAGIEFLWHPSLSSESANDARRILEQCASGETPLDALCIEGAMLRGPGGSGRFHVLAGTGIAMIEWVKQLASVAKHTLAIGTCAAYGGVSAAGDNVPRPADCSMRDRSMAACWATPIVPAAACRSSMSRVARPIPTG